MDTNSLKLKLDQYDLNNLQRNKSVYRILSQISILYLIRHASVIMNMNLQLYANKQTLLKEK